MVDQIQEDTSGTGTTQTTLGLLTVIIIAVLEKGSVWMLHYFDFCQLKPDAIRWSPCSAHLTLQDAEESGLDPTKHLSDSISLNGTTCALKIKHALKCFAGLMPACATSSKVRFIVSTRVLLWFSFTCRRSVWFHLLPLWACSSSCDFDKNKWRHWINHP